MSSLTLHITHNLVSKKVTFPKSTTINQVAQTSLDKFGVKDANVVGQLLYNDKVLDTSLPLRLTSLTNNAKLKLVLVSGNSQSSPINIKLSISHSNETKTVIGKSDPNLTLREILHQFGTANGIDLLLEPSQLVILNTTYSSEEYKKQLKAIVGSVTSLVIRMSFVKSKDENQKRIEEQKAIVEKQLKLQRERNEKLKQEKLKEKEAQERARNIKVEETINENTGYVDPNPARETIAQETGSVDPYSAKQTTELPTHLQEAPTDDSIYKKFQETPTESPQLYLPESLPASSYENPDEDYEMTVGQAKSYHKLIQDSAKRKKKVVHVPTKYNLRIKFPDRSILQINLLENVQNIKFGQLIKKIDELLLDEFVGNYHLKLGYPPFQKIQFSFDYNNSFLVKLPEFQSERSVLIWEYSGEGSQSGPYIKSDKISDVKTASELPEVILESHRGELPGETIKPVAKSESKVSKDSAEKKGSKLPKWFKSK